jgi:crotonobetainyl-CoA:carnitine CoA-transferase CaiB-like acyl-CoA transferase
LGIERGTDCAAEHPAVTWARSGLMSLTGPYEGEPLMCPVPLAACADGVLAALASFSRDGAFAGLRGSQLMTERAAIMGLARNGAISPGGACRLLEASDGWIAVNLARPDDWSLLPAWLECDGLLDWGSLAHSVRQRSAKELVGRGRLLGLAVARDEMQGGGAGSWFALLQEGNGKSRSQGFPLVIDLSSLWAGPLCSHLLRKLGARVIKVESSSRLDGARQGPAVMFNLLNAEKQSVTLDFRTAEGREQLRRLLDSADIVIEGSRPRALRQLGINAEELVNKRSGLAWISITGYGRGEPQENWTAYGDDAGVAAGLSSLMEQASGQRVIVGDAIGDPLTGMHAALAAWAGYLSGGGLYSLSLHGVVSHCTQFDRPASPESLRARQKDWTKVVAGLPIPRPRFRGQHDWAREPGADTHAVLAELATS